MNSPQAADKICHFVFLLLVSWLVLPGLSIGQTLPETILHNFQDGTVTNDGAGPFTNVIQATDGNFYGTTNSGGSGDTGTLFRMTPQGAVTILYSFPSQAASGGNSDGFPNSPLLEGADGSFYGVSEGSGFNDGTVFNLTSSGVFTLLHNFADTEGSGPRGGLIEDGNGNFYGTTYQEGAFGGGTVFEISLTRGGGGQIVSENFSVLYSFSGANVHGDGYHSQAGLVFDRNGNLYGTTADGGSAGYGTVFKLSQTNGVWSETILYSFSGGSDGGNPVAPLIFGSDGKLYGSTSANSIFSITTSGTFSLIHHLGGTTEGGSPLAGLIQGTDGNFYGTTSKYSTYPYGGTVFKVTPGGTLTTLHVFTGPPADGLNPYASVVLGTDGNLYGTTLGGGSASSGTVFEVALPSTATSDTPTMPFWALVGLALFLFLAASFSLRDHHLPSET